MPELPWPRLKPFLLLLAVFFSLLISLSTLQTDINQSDNPYTTDTGEIQNALPRWGTIHDNGYPLYTALGSAFVSIAQRAGTSPATAAGLYSAVWGAIGIALLTGFLFSLGIQPLIVLVVTLLYSVSKSYWVDASIAEIHTMTIALSIATLWTAVAFSRSGQKRHLLLLALLGGQILAHQRAFALFLPAIFLLVYPHWRLILRNIPLCLLLGLLGPLTYFYLPWRAWQGADWLYGDPGSWDGLYNIMFYSRANLIALPQNLAEWLRRTQVILALLADDWPAWLMVAGLGGLFFAPLARRERIALTLGWLVHVPVCFMVWEGRISDALLAVKMPITFLAAVGLAILTQTVCTQTLWQKRPLPGTLLALIWLATAGWLFAQNRPGVLAITRAQSEIDWVALARQVPPSSDGRSRPFVAFWGNAYWQLMYHQTFNGEFPHLQFMQHNLDWGVPVRQGQSIFTTSDLFLYRPLTGWWQLPEPVALNLVAPGVVEVREKPPATTIAPVSSPAQFDLQNGITIQQAHLKRDANGRLLLHVQWQAAQSNLPNYGVELLLITPKTSPQPSGVRIQQPAPVDTLYPTSRWQVGEQINDVYLLQSDNQPVAVLVCMYHIVAHQIERTPWLRLDIPTG